MATTMGPAVLPAEYARIGDPSIIDSKLDAMQRDTYIGPFGMKIVRDRNLKSWQGMLVQPGSTWRDLNKFVFLDMRKPAHSGDMGTMIDDLLRHGGMDNFGRL